MKSIVITFLILTIGCSTYAQNLNSKRSILTIEKPIVIINDSTIASLDLLKKIASKHVLELNIFKESTLSSTHLFIENEKSEGLIIAKVKQDFKVKSQKALNLFFGLNAMNDIYINGYLIENKNQNISTESIIGIEIIKADNFRLKKSVLNITMA